MSDLETGLNGVMYDFCPCARFGRDGESLSLREETRARRCRRRHRFCNRRIGGIVRIRCASRRDRFMGSVAGRVWRISRVRKRLLPLSGQLLDTGVR